MFTVLKKSAARGVQVPHHKSTQELETVKMPLPEKMVIPMLQHIGAPCKPLVRKGDRVKVGQKIGESEAFVSAPIHSSVSGAVKDVKPILHAGGFEVDCVEIEPDGLQEVSEEVFPIACKDKRDILKAIRESGLVGLGGAGFPAWIKLSPADGKRIDTLVVNGAECEPYITADYREMMENPQGIIEGIRTVMCLTGAERALIGIEANKPKAIKLFNEMLTEEKAIEVVVLPSKYPQGGEKQLIYSATGRKVPRGKLPSDVGVVVHNVNTLSFITNFLKTGMPLIKKKVTVDGSAVKEPKNVEIPIGTSLRDVFQFCGGFKEEPHKIIMGGPMMGVSQFSLDNTVIKNTNALLAFTKAEAEGMRENPCIRCGKCVSVCPMNLLPVYINANVMKAAIEETVRYNVNDCIECGSCSFVCPAKRHLVQSIRYAKAALRKTRKV